MQSYSLKLCASLDTVLRERVSKGLSMEKEEDRKLVIKDFREVCFSYFNSENQKPVDEERSLFFASYLLQVESGPVLSCIL